MIRAWMFFLLIAAAGPAGQAYAQEEADEVEAAKEHFDAGVKYFNEGKIDDALKEFRVSYKLKPHWKIRFNIAMCYYEKKAFVDAAREMSKFLNEGGNEIPEKQKAMSTDVLTEARKNVGIIKFSGEMEGTTVQVDGKEVTELEAGQQIYTLPGKHHIFVQYKDKVILDEEIELEAGMAREIVTTVVSGGGTGEVEVKVEKPGPEGENPLPPPPDEGKGKAMLSAGIGLIAAGAAGLIVGSVLGGLVFKEKSDMQKAQDDYMEEYNNGARDPDTLADLEKDRDDHYDTAKGYAMGANVLIPLGGALVVTSIVLLVLGTKKAGEARPATAGLLLGPSSLALDVRF
jgi:hypothetical protein